jgi:hypothetical protein
MITWQTWLCGDVKGDSFLEYVGFLGEDAFCSLVLFQKGPYLLLDRAGDPQGTGSVEDLKELAERLVPELVRLAALAEEAP